MVRRIDEKEKGVWRSLDWWTILIYMALLAFGWISICGASYDFDMEGNIFFIRFPFGDADYLDRHFVGIGLYPFDARREVVRYLCIRHLCPVACLAVCHTFLGTRHQGLPFVDKDRTFQFTVCRVCQMCHGIGFGQIHVCLRI